MSEMLLPHETVFERIESLMSTQGKTQKELIDYLKLARTTYGNWKSQKSHSYLKHINEIANFFNVSPNYLIKGEETVGQMNINSACEDEIIRLCRLITPEKLKTVISLLHYLAT